jgi:threonyl-tRNA synthetase
VDNERLWLKTEEMVRNAMHNGGVPFVEVPDEAAFYGPKIDVQIWSAIGREFTLATNQVDFAVPERFDLTFVNAEGHDETPLCIHRAPLSTHERMIGFLIEHYAGAFPVWLAPEQVRVIPITDGHGEYASQVAAQLRQAGIRGAADLGQRADECQDPQRPAHEECPTCWWWATRRWPTTPVSLRRRDGSRQNDLPVAEFIAATVERIRTRSSEL